MAPCRKVMKIWTVLIDADIDRVYKHCDIEALPWVLVFHLHPRVPVAERVRDAAD